MASIFNPYAQNVFKKLKLSKIPLLSQIKPFQYSYSGTETRVPGGNPPAPVQTVNYKPSNQEVNLCCIGERSLS